MRCASCGLLPAYCGCSEAIAGVLKSSSMRLPCTRCGAADHCFADCQRESLPPASVFERLALELEIMNRRAEYERGLVGSPMLLASVPGELERRRLALEAAIARRKP